MLSKLLSVFVAIELLLTDCGIEHQKIAASLERYYIEENVIYNNEQGYSFSIPDNFSLNEEFYPNNLRFECNDTTIEIYTHKAETKESADSYINYTTNISVCQ